MQKSCTAPSSSGLPQRGTIPRAPASDPGNSSTGKEELRAADELPPEEGKAEWRAHMSAARGERRQAQELQETPIQKETASALSPGLEEDT